MKLWRALHNFKKDHIYDGPGGKEIAVVMPAPNDQTAPTIGTLTCSSVTSTTVQVTWTASTDSGGSGLAGYKVYRQRGTGASLPVGTVGASTLTFLDQPLTPSTGYTYTLRAFDQAQNHSVASNAITVTTGGTCSGGGGGGSGYQYYRQITINTGQVPSTQSNFPVLVSGHYSYLATTGNGGKVQSSNGIDIKFTSDSARNSILPYEQEKYSANGDVAYWVKLPSVSDGTSFYMFYGNASATDQSNKTAVWDSNYKGVWHLSQTSGGSGAIKDSTSTANNATDHNSPTLSATAKIDGGTTFNSTQYLDTTKTDSSSLPLGTSAVTVEAWLKTTSTNEEVFFAYGSEQGIGVPEYFRLNVNMVASDRIGTRTIAGRRSFNAPGITNGNWHHVVVGTAASDTPVNLKVYMDGTLLTSSADNTATSAWNIGGGSPVIPVAIGADAYEAGFYWNGSIDEVRLSNTLRSADWVRTEYNNENAPDTFYGIGTEQSTGGGGGGGGGSCAGYGGYSCRRQITINGGQVPSTQSNFPVLISGQYSYLATESNGGKVKSAIGIDIKFASDAAGTNVLPYEQEKYVNDGTIAYWVKLSSVSDGASFYMFYGNASATDQSNKTAVWDSNYKGVWHLSQTSGGSGAIKDSTSTANNATDHNGPTLGATAKIDGGTSFNGSTHYLDTTKTDSSSIPLGTSAVTVEAWLKTTSTSEEVFFAYGSEAGIGVPEYFRLNVNMVATDRIGTRTIAGRRSFDAPGITNGSWHHVVIGTAANDTPVNLKIYMDGTLLTSSGDNTATSAWNIGGGSPVIPVAIGADAFESSFYWNGSIDEIRISNVLRSADWIRTEYNNQNNPSTFYAIGAEQ